MYSYCFLYELQALRLRKQYDVANPIEKSIYTDLNSSLTQLTPGTSVGSSKSRELSDDKWDIQKSQQQKLKNMVKASIDTLVKMRAKIYAEPYANVDFELSTCQIPIIGEMLEFYDQAYNSILFDETVLLNAFWMELLDLFIGTLDSIPECLTHVYVRDMRFTVAGLLNGIDEDDPIEYRLVYDLSAR